MATKVRNVIAPLLLAAFTVACSDGSNDPSNQEIKVPKRDFDPAILAQGERLYAMHCAGCHGEHAQGAPEWTRRRADGSFPAPPLNGTGHTWHHPQAALVGIIRNGTQRIGGSMPPWKDRLSDAQIEAILAWAKSQWPRELYEAWYRMDRASRQAR